MLTNIFNITNNIPTTGVKKILVLADYGKGVSTGYSRVSDNILSEIKNFFGEKISFSIIAINYFGEPYTDSNGIVISGKLSVPEKLDDFGRFAMLRALKEESFDGLWMLNDLSVIAPIAPILRDINLEKKKNNAKQFKTMFYFPVDGQYGPITKELTAGIEMLDSLVTYTEFGRNEIIKWRPELKTRIKVIPHGNNPNEFFHIPKEEVMPFRKQYFGEQNAGKFIVNCTNRNQPRKDIPTTILGFHEYRRDYNPDSLLYLNMNCWDEMGWKIHDLMRQLDMHENEHYMTPRKGKENHGLTIEELNNVYNASDVFLTTCTGGGYELTPCEAASCLVPVIAPRHTSLAEIGANDRFLFLEDFELRAHNWDNIFRPACFPEEVAEKLDLVFNEQQSDSIKLSNRIHNAKKYFDNLSWKSVCKTWIRYFSETYNIQ